MAGALGAAFVIFVATANGIDALADGRLGGDFPAFYAAGDLARTNPGGLLDPTAQARAQQAYVPGGWAPFPYPPVLAFLFAPVSLLPFNVAYVLYVGLLFIAGMVAVMGTLDILDVRSRDWRRVGLLGGMTFAPMVRSVAGAQNASLTLLILVRTVQLMRDGRQVPAGLVAGLLWFKPQYAVPATGLLVVSGRWKAGLASVVPGLGLWMANAVVFGAGWTAAWWSEIISVTSVGNKIFNTALTVSPVEYLRGTLPASLAEPLALLLAAAVGLVFVMGVRTRRHPEWWLALSCAALLLTALHALPYELALLIPVLGLGLHRKGRDGLPVAVVLYGLGWLVVAGGVHPVLRIVVLVLAVLWGTVGHKEPVRGLDRPAFHRPEHA